MRPDLVLVVGTSLRVPAVRQIVQYFGKSLVSDSGILVWLNTEGPRKSLNVNWDLLVQQDCQMVAKELILQLNCMQQPIKHMRHFKHFSKLNQFNHFL